MVQTLHQTVEPKKGRKSRRQYRSIPALNALALTCRQAYIEGIQIYYRHNLIQVPYSLLRKFVTDIRAAEYQAIQQLGLTLTVFAEFHERRIAGRPEGLLMASLPPLRLFQGLRYLQISGQMWPLYDLCADVFVPLVFEHLSAEDFFEAIGALEKLEVVEWLSESDGDHVHYLDNFMPLCASWCYSWTPYRLSHLAAKEFLGVAGRDDINHEVPVLGGWRDTLVEYLEK